jgi:hypothetical protein
VLLDVADLEQAAHPGIDKGTVARQLAELDPQTGVRRTRPGALEYLEGRPQGSLITVGQAACPVQLGHHVMGTGTNPCCDRCETTTA